MNAKQLLFTLQLLHRYISNCGRPIKFLTLCINFALFPMKIKSCRSILEMQKIAPEMKSIQDRYKKYSMTDPRRKNMQTEMAELYEKHGINPMVAAFWGAVCQCSCKMPIWWSLWRVLTGAIELRHAPWIFWIRDLSIRDPYYILPILMAITMYTMTKMIASVSGHRSGAAKDDGMLMPLMFAALLFQLCERPESLLCSRA